MWRVGVLLIVLAAVLSACAGPSVVLYPFPPYDPTDQRVARYPGLRFPSREVRVLVRAHSFETEAGQLVTVDAHETKGWQDHRGVIYVPVYTREVSLATRIRDPQPGEPRYTKPERKTWELGGYWHCGRVPNCRDDDPPPVEFQAREPIVVQPPTRQPPPVERPQVVPPVAPRYP